MDPALLAQMKPYEPWLIIGGVFLLFYLLRMTRQGLRRRVDELGIHLLGERGLLIWFWLNAPGVMLHELSHAVVVLLLYPFGFRVTHITLFRIKPVVARQPNGQVIRRSGRQSLQLGEVQYVRPPARMMSHVGDGLSAIAPLFGGILMLALLYWAATGYNIWDINFQLIRPGWPWWTLIFCPYLILTVTSELWPSRQDWRGARWFGFGLSLLLILLLALLWYTKYLVFNHQLLLGTSSIATHIDFILLMLLALDLVFLLIAEVLVRLIV
ncbi:MAG TPA: hypothetical protein VFN23_17965 [Ktedonobacteraceae bacterium]|nr:hypothetical protein [Ktedonobacteraceae bacterium]